MSKLTKFGNKHHHYYEDEQGRTQGEWKWIWANGQISDHCFFKDNKIHSECKKWRCTGELEDHRFYQNGNDITLQVKALVDDILNITKEERMMIKLKFGIECIS